MYYGLRENLGARIVRSFTKKPAAARALTQECENRLGIILFRIGWAGCFKEAHTLLSEGRVRVRRAFNRSGLPPGHSELAT